MFTTARVEMCLSKATLRIVEDDRGVPHRVANVGLTIDPLPAELAQELGDAVYSYLFDGQGVIKRELGRIVLDPRVPQQTAHVLTAPDMRNAYVQLRHVDVLGLGVNVEEDKKTGARSLRATFRLQFGISEREHRDFLAAKFGDMLWWTFGPEQHPLQLEGVAPRG